MEAAEDGRLISCANEAASHDNMMETIETRGRKVLIIRMHLEAGQGAEI